MNRHLLNGVLLLWLVSCSIAVLAIQQQNTATPKVTSQQVKPARTGEQVFSDNCSRCHTPPMAISPRITGTIIMHMRTRARLSQKDQELLLKYLAP
jgi:cytochrome c5